MTRKINYKNLEKLSTRGVIIVAVLSIIYFVFLWSQESSIMQNYSDGIALCPGGMESCYAIWHKYLHDYRSAQLWSGLIGFVVPIFYFIGKIIFNYVYPQTEI